MMQREQTLIPVDMDQEEVALRFQKYALISAAVVDAVRPAGRHDHRRRHRPHHPGGSERGRAAAVRRGEGDINEPVIDSYKARVRWLIANLGTALVAATIIACSKARSSDGGARRADADRRRRRRQCRHADAGGDGARARHQPADRSNRWRAVGREMRVALLNGLTIAVLIGIGVTLVFGSPLLGG
jgi:magnesium transporter